jgi:hypothetical protein
LLLTFLFLLPLWWRDGAGSAWLIPELGLLWLLARFSPRSWWTGLLASLLCFAFLALAGDALVRDVLDRPLNLLLDPLLLQAGFHFLSGSLGVLTAVLILVTVLALIGLIIWGFCRLLEAIRSLDSSLAGSLLTLAAMALVILGLRFEHLPALNPALVTLSVSQTGQVRSSLEARTRLLRRAGSAELRAQPIPALAGRDVFVVFVESYGISAWTQRDYRAVIDPVLARAQAGLEAAGLETMSTRLRSPIRGGQSWLAHASLLSGQRIDNDLAYREVLASPQDFLSDDLAATGHQTLVVAPAILRPWPEARALGFQHVYPAAALEYPGPGSGWVGIPDQFTLHRAGRIRASHPRPAFALLLLISSHAPWLEGPPLLDDWRRLDQAQPWPDWTPPPRDRLAYLRDVARLRARYPQSLAYSLEAVLGWAARDLPPGALLLVLGDHQPTTLITGSETSADVPFHLISADARELSRPEDGLRFRAGLEPPPDSAEAGLEDVRGWLRSRARPAAIPGH